MKKIVCLICVATLLLGSATTVSAKGWKTYFGLNKGWYEGMGAKMTKNNAHNWTAKVSSIGWGGCWGGQVFKNYKVKKGNYYHISFTIKSTKLSKYVYLKLGNTNGKKNNVSKWINCKKRKTVKVSFSFKAKHNSKTIYFGIGGDFGDRAGVKTDSDAKRRYKAAKHKKLDSRLGPDAAAKHPTKIIVKNFRIYKTYTAYYNYKHRCPNCGYRW